jgi:hypothetical protein
MDELIHWYAPFGSGGGTTLSVTDGYRGQGGDGPIMPCPIPDIKQKVPVASNFRPEREKTASLLKPVMSQYSGIEQVTRVTGKIGISSGRRGLGSTLRDCLLPHTGRINLTTPSIRLHRIFRRFLRIPVKADSDSGRSRTAFR